MLRVPNAKRGEQNQKWLSHPAFSGGPKEGGNATSPLQARGSPTPSAGNRSNMVASALPCREAKKRAKILRPLCFSEVPNANRREQNYIWSPHPCLVVRPKRGQKCYVTPASSGVPNAKRREQNQKWLSQPCLLGGPKEGGNALPPLPSQGAPMPSEGSKIRNGCLTPALS